MTQTILQELWGRTNTSELSKLRQKVYVFVSYKDMPQDANCHKMGHSHGQGSFLLMIELGEVSAMN
jgi:hypothetical protein